MTRLEKDIAALADGSYERPGLRERIAASPELAALLDEQLRAVALTRAASPDAPDSLRAALADAGAARPAAARPRRPLLGVLVAAAGVAALGVVAVLPSHASPSVAAIAGIAARGPSAPPPQVDPGHRGALQSQLDGVRYPYWQDAFGWETSGTRTDRVDGRSTMTVYYADATKAMVDYTIVGGSPLPEPAGATVQQAGGTRYLGLRSGGRTIVTWRRAGHTCVISATGVPLPTLLRLAEWRYDATRA